MESASLLVGSLLGCAFGSLVLPIIGLALVALHRTERARADLALWRAVEPSISTWSATGGREVFIVSLLDGERVRVESPEGRATLVCSASEWADRASKKGYRMRSR